MCGFLGSALLLRDLDLGRTGLSDIPDVIFSLRDLQTLNVSSNSISEVQNRALPSLMNVSSIIWHCQYQQLFIPKSKSPLFCIQQCDAELTGRLH